MKLLSFFFLLITSFLYSQKNYLAGVVYESDIPQANIAIVNTNTGVIWITNDKGEFKIYFSTYDKFVFTRTDLEDYILNISTIDAKGIMKVVMVKKAITLKEVTIKNYSKINPVSLGIVPKDQKTYTPAQRKLYTAGDFKPIHLLNLLGGPFQFDPILNKINGRTKELKKNIEIEKKEMNMRFLKEKYNDFFLTNLKLKEEQIDAFLYYLVEESKINEKISLKDDNQFKFFLSEVLVKYKKDNSVTIDCNDVAK